MGGELSGCTEETTDVFLEVALFDPVRTPPPGASSASCPTPATASSAASIRNRPLGRRGRGAPDPGALRRRGEPRGQRRRDARTRGARSPAARPRRHPRRPRPAGRAPAPRSSSDLGFEWPRQRQDRRSRCRSWRPDVEGEACLVEEVLRIHGFDAHPAGAADLDTALPLPALTRASAAVSAPHGLAWRGLDEAVTFSFLSGARPAVRRRARRPAPGQPDQQRPRRHAPGDPAQPGRGRGAATPTGAWATPRSSRSAPVPRRHARRPGPGRRRPARRAVGPRHWGPAAAGRRLRRQGRRAGGARGLRRAGRQPAGHHRRAGLVPPGPLRRAAPGPQGAGPLRRAAPQGRARLRPARPGRRLRGLPGAVPEPKAKAGQAAPQLETLALPPGRARLRLRGRRRGAGRKAAARRQGRRQGADRPRSTSSTPSRARASRTARSPWPSRVTLQPPDAP